MVDTPEGRRAVSQARPLLLSDICREPSDTAVVRELGAAHRSAEGADKVTAALSGEHLDGKEAARESCRKIG